MAEKRKEEGIEEQREWDSRGEGRKRARSGSFLVRPPPLHCIFSLISPTMNKASPASPVNLASAGSL